MVDELVGELLSNHSKGNTSTHQHISKSTNQHISKSTHQPPTISKKSQSVWLRLLYKINVSIIRTKELTS